MLAHTAILLALYGCTNNTAHDGGAVSQPPSICAPAFTPAELELTAKLWGISTECPGLDVVVVDIPEPNVGGRLMPTEILVDVWSLDNGLADIVIAHETGHYLGHQHCESACTCDIMAPSVSTMSLECVRGF
jgi:hypothetical protein